MIRNQGVLSAIGVTVMAAVILLVLHEWREQPTVVDDAREPPPALIVERVSARTFTETGDLQYDLRAERITEMDARGETLVETPRLALHDPALAWELTAERGEVRDRGRHVTLRGAVEARDHGPDGLLVQSEELVYESALERLTSPGAVEITHPGGRTRAGAMQASSADGEVQLLQQVESRYDPN
ncbi:MAG: LPS export ABC transporter periplasmic protein LptC [Alcanivorax sp.]|nr:LPS export ABC transporter periplasmic protein LptC [Alcanivorax sp.]